MATIRFRDDRGRVVLALALAREVVATEHATVVLARPDRHYAVRGDAMVHVAGPPHRTPQFIHGHDCSSSNGPGRSTTAPTTRS